jgi:hypothetical protein
MLGSARRSSTTPADRSIRSRRATPPQGHIRLAAWLLTCLSMIILFLLAQRWTVSGMRPTSGIKQFLECVMPRITVDPTPTFSISPRLYMQFMEPLGTTDASVEAAWDYDIDEWRKDFVATVRDLAPGAIRWGGILTSYWRWQEGVGPRECRKPMINYLWGGVEPNQVGVHEFLGLCEEVGAEPILAVNFASDGRPEYINTVLGERRAGTAQDGIVNLTDFACFVPVSGRRGLRIFNGLEASAMHSNCSNLLKLTVPYRGCCGSEIRPTVQTCTSLTGESALGQGAATSGSCGGLLYSLNTEVQLRSGIR